jgi:2-polyprenyl-6-methoxyphenol hydroxylase-like FAD-dependent oxidoreductase
MTEHEKISWTICLECEGLGKKSRKFKKKEQHHPNPELNRNKKTKEEDQALVRPNLHLYECTNCAGSGLVPSANNPLADKENFPHVAIIGGGIGGIALAVACLHRGIPFTIYERDSSFDKRSQGYGLTLQQASIAIKGLGIFALNEGVHSTKHVVHTSEGKIIGEWGHRTRMNLVPKRLPKRTNIHIARQTLRLALLEQLGGKDEVMWGHQLIDFKNNENKGVELTFQVNGELKTSNADLVVGADGIRSVVRKLVIGEDKSPLRYLGCIVILGICPLSALNGLQNSLLDSATVFQTSNGNDRIYIMPYSKDTVMWQLSFPMPEKEAMELSAQGAQALKEEACRRTQWHEPVPQIVSATAEELISGYPVYDRELLKQEIMEEFGNVTLLGDAAHPMSPFKGQGANQALLDALSLAREITKRCKPLSKWREVGIRKTVLKEFETEMLERSAIKVKDSAEAVRHLHSESVLYERNGPRGKGLKKKDL